MALPHQVYTPPGQAPGPRTSMAMSRIRRTPYVESGAPLTGVTRNAAWNPAQVMEAGKLSESREGWHGHRNLYGAMKAGGPGAVPPIHVDTGSDINAAYGGSNVDNNAKLAIGNGGHRVAAANALGWKRINISDHRSATGDDQGGAGGGRPAMSMPAASAGYYPQHPVLSAAQFSEGT